MFEFHVNVLCTYIIVLYIFFLEISMKLLCIRSADPTDIVGGLLQCAELVWTSRNLSFQSFRA